MTPVNTCKDHVQASQLRHKNSAPKPANKCFTFRSVRKSDLNFSYFPATAAIDGTNCINIKMAPGCNGIYTFYSYKNQLGQLFNLADEFKGDFLMVMDELHTPAIHKKTDPKEIHCHVHLPKESNPDQFIKELSDESPLHGNFRKQLYASARYLKKNPNEPGLTFKDGSYTENGGAQSFDVTTSAANAIQGPLNLIDESNIDEEHIDRAIAFEEQRAVRHHCAPRCAIS